MKSKNDDYRLVYSSETPQSKICKKCGELQCKCQSAEEVNPQNTTIKIRLEKNARGGKTVSVLFELPNNPDYFKDLCKKLKNHCGTGGSYKNNTIEIQGDQRTKIVAYLEKVGFRVKLAGG